LKYSVNMLGSCILYCDGRRARLCDKNVASYDASCQRYHICLGPASPETAVAFLQEAISMSYRDVLCRQGYASCIN